MSDIIKPMVRPLQLSDVPIVAMIAETAMVSPWGQAVFKDCLKADYHAWVVTLGDHGFANEVLGFVVLLVQMGEAQLLNIAVRPQHQEKGLGKLLLEHAIASSKKLEAQKMVIEVRASNLQAIAFYQRMGFQQVGMRREYYPLDDGREDALLFCLSI